MKKIGFLSALAAALLLSCNTDKDGGHVDSTAAVTFEDAELTTEGFMNNASYAEHVAVFENIYDLTYDYWHGFAVSSCTDTETGGYANQYSVYAQHGAAGSHKFGVCYYDGMEPSRVRFRVPSADMKCIYVNNSTYAALAMRDGTEFSRKFADGDWFLLSVAGYKGEQEKGRVEFYLADFRDGKTYICNEWTRLDLTALADVDRLDFTLASSDATEQWINTPTYVCVDNLVYSYRLEY